MIDQEPTPATQQGVEVGDDSPIPTTAPPRRGWSPRGRATAPQEIRILAVVVAVGMLLSLTTRAFLTEANVTAVAIGSATDAIIAIAMTIVLIGGGFDLSVGAVLALSGIVLALLIQAGLSTPLAVAATLALGAIIGTANGVIITKVRVNPLITTLGMMSIASSVALILSGGAPSGTLPNDLLFIGQGLIAGLPVSVLITILLVVMGDVLLRRTRWLRLVYYVGGNERAAALSGVPVDRVRIASYVLTGIAACFAGIVSTARLGSAFPQAGAGTELRVIAACVIGGCSLAGGEGSIVGSLLGVILLALINNGLVLLNVSIYWQGVVSGLVLIAAVAFDMLSRRGRRR